MRFDLGFGMYQTDEDGKFDQVNELVEMVHRLAKLVYYLNHNTMLSYEERQEIDAFAHFAHQHSCYEDEMPPECDRLIAKGKGIRVWHLKQDNDGTLSGRIPLGT